MNERAKALSALAKVARGATVLLGIAAIVLGIIFKGQNVAYMVGLAFALAKRFPLGTLQRVPISQPSYSQCSGGASPQMEQLQVC